MNPEKTIREYISAIGSGIRFILTIVASAIIAGKITKLFGTNNFFIFALVLFCIITAIYAAIDFYLSKGKSASTKPLQRGGYD
jgi:hypothetical protein